MTPPRQYSKLLLAASLTVALLLTGGTIVAAMKVIDASGGLVENPLVAPTVPPKEVEPPAPLVSPTVTVTVTPVPDVVRVKQNSLYKVGAIRSVGCKEPTIRPNSKDAILRYYRAVLPCLDRTWGPLVRKAGYEFRVPKVVVFTGNESPSKCTGDSDTAFYCGREQTIYMRWQDDLKYYRQSPSFGRAYMLHTLAHEYGHHVQMLTNIMISSASREGWAKTQPAKLEENRRLELQASCLGAAFAGANQKSLGLNGDLGLRFKRVMRYSGDEYNPAKIRDHGSRRNHWYWTKRAYDTPDPKMCNTFTAPASRVS